MVFSEQISLKNICYSEGGSWERIVKPVVDSELSDLYNERNYFYEFVHNALYDDGEDSSLVRHFERNEPKHGDVIYVIDCGDKGCYELKVDAININLFSTGVGVLSFYLKNDKYADPASVFRINQRGRRVFPPFIDDVEYRSLIAHTIEIKGLHGRDTGYREDFRRYTNKTQSNEPASFITDIINEVASNIFLKPVVDDRMFVQCWYKNDEWAEEFSGDNYHKFINSPKWYEFVFVDELNDMTCQNNNMQHDIIKKATYPRWQKWSSLYGISRYSMVLLTNNSCPPYLLNYFDTMYVRMAELVLVQKASVLRFSAEVTELSRLDDNSDFSRKVNSLYKEYIRFVNQIHFREVSAQDQGIEMYHKLYESMRLEMHVEKLDSEIEELYNYAMLSEDRKNNKTISLLTWIATIFVPMTLVAGIFGMNNKAFGDNDYWYNDLSTQLIIVAIVTIIVLGIIQLKNRRVK